MPPALADSSEEYDPEDQVAESMSTPLSWLDFQRHFDSVMNRLMDRADSGSSSLSMGMVEVMESFDAVFGEDEAARHFVSMGVALTHIWQFKHEYDTEIFGVAHNEGLFVSEGLKRALYWHFVVRARTEWGSNEQAIRDIKEWARDWTAKNNQANKAEDMTPRKLYD